MHKFHKAYLFGSLKSRSTSKRMHPDSAREPRALSDRTRSHSSTQSGLTTNSAMITRLGCGAINVAATVGARLASPLLQRVARPGAPRRGGNFPRRAKAIYLQRRHSLPASQPKGREKGPLQVCGCLPPRSAKGGGMSDGADGIQVGVASTFVCEPVGRWIGVWLHAVAGVRPRLRFAGYQQLHQELRQPVAFRAAPVCLALIRFADWQRDRDWASGLSFDAARFEADLQLLCDGIEAFLGAQTGQRLLLVLCPASPAASPAASHAASPPTTAEASTSASVTRAIHAHAATSAAVEGVVANAAADGPAADGADAADADGADDADTSESAQQCAAFAAATARLQDAARRAPRLSVLSAAELASWCLTVRAPGFGFSSPIPWP